MILDDSLRDFADALASREPIPGGGAAASYVGALGAALAGMAIAYSIKDDSAADAGSRILKEEGGRMDERRAALLRLTERDSQAYGAFSKAVKLPKKTAEEKTRRKERIRASLEEALHVPLEAAERCLEGLRGLGAVADRVNPRLLTDVGISAQCFATAVRSCWYNVMVNALSLKDAERTRDLAARESRSVREAEDLEAAIRRRVDGALGLT